MKIDFASYILLLDEVIQEMYRKTDIVVKEIKDIQKDYEYKIKSIKESSFGERLQQKKEINSYYLLAKEFLEDNNIPFEHEQMEEYKDLNINLLSSLWKEMDNPTYNFRKRVLAAKKICMISKNYFAGIEMSKENFRNDKVRREEELIKELQGKIQEKEQEIDNIKSYSLNLLKSDRAKTQLKDIHLLYETIGDVSELDFYSNYDITNVSLGFIEKEISVDSDVQHKLEILSNGMIKNSRITQPVIVEIEKLQIVIEASNLNDEKLQKGVQSIIAQFLMRINQELLNIYFVDVDLWSGKRLGILEEISFCKAFRNIAKSKENFNEIVRSLLEVGRENEQKLISNQHNDSSKINLLVVYGHKENYCLEVKENLNLILGNADRFKISYLIVENKENRHENRIYRPQYYISVEEERCFINNSFQFQWLNPITMISENYKRKLQELSKKRDQGFSYEDFVNKTNHTILRGDARTNLQVAFGLDEKEQIAYAPLVNDNFAAFISGASGSGKSTLLHMIIMELIRNYHPDDLDLWLIDFNRKEFAPYINAGIPHIKNVVLESEREVVFDLIEQLSEEMENRMLWFQKNGYSDITEVPNDIYMPRIVVIIDEFKVMADILRESVVSNRDYAKELEALLRRTRAFGFNYIFANQNYSTGLAGLSEVAKNQIQSRFAMSNTIEKEEVKATIAIGQSEMTEKIQRMIDMLPPHQVIYKKMENGKVYLNQFRTFKIEKSNREQVIKQVSRAYNQCSEYQCDDVYVYKKKETIYIAGEDGIAFYDDLPLIQSYEDVLSKQKDFYDKYEDDDILLYLGRPCKVSYVNPIKISCRKCENLLLLGENSKYCSDVILAAIESFYRNSNISVQGIKNIVIWNHKRDKIYRRIEKNINKSYQRMDSVMEIFEYMNKITERILHGQTEHCLIVVLGLEQFLEDIKDMELLEEMKKDAEETQEITMRFHSLTEQIDYVETTKDYSSVNLKKTLVKKKLNEEEFIKKLRKVLELAPTNGYHFLLSFKSWNEFKMTKLMMDLFNHRLMFKAPKEISWEVFRDASGSEIREGVVRYSNDIGEKFTIKPYVF